MRLEVEALGVPVLRRDLLRIADRAVDASPAMAGILDSLYDHAARQFDTEGGGKWTPPSDDWIARKAALGLDSRTEQATLELRDSLTKRGGANVAVVRGDGLIFDSTVKHAPYAKRRNTLIAPSEAERRQWIRQVQAWIVDADRSPRGGLLAGIV